MSIGDGICGGKSSGKAAGVLALTASPAFAAMAVVTGLCGGSPMAMCPMADASPFGSMAVMYLLMCLFHAAPWVRLIGRMRSR